jgi:uncharacterized protein DUF4387
MTTLGELATQVRSKNAGPFWMTIDVFLKDDDAYERASRSSIADPAAIGRLYATDPAHVRVFLLPLLRAIKVSLPRPVVQGSVGDRDMHAGQQYVPLLDLPVASSRSGSG